MITAVTYTDIIKTLFSFLKSYSTLTEDQINNKDSIRGVDLLEMINETESYSPNAADSFLLFELLEDVTGEHYVTKGEQENESLTIQSYIFHLTVYGNSASQTMQRLSAIFKQEDLVMELRDKGIFINGVGAIEPINEFINNTLLLRRDLEIKLQVRYNISDIGTDVGYFEKLAEPIIVK